MKHSYKEKCSSTSKCYHATWFNLKHLLCRCTLCAETSLSEVKWLFFNAQCLINITRAHLTHAPIHPSIQELYLSIYSLPFYFKLSFHAISLLHTVLTLILSSGNKCCVLSCLSMYHWSQWDLAWHDKSKDYISNLMNNHALLTRDQ